MANPEQETIILLNDADREDGYFQFGTSKKDHYRRLLTRIGGEEKLVGMKVDFDEEGNPRWWQCKVPMEFLHVASFGLRGRKRQMTPEKLAQLVEMRKKAKEHKTGSAE